MDKKIKKGACLPLGEETQALGSTGFQGFRELLTNSEEKGGQALWL
jgi:hypothetical protein